VKKILSILLLFVFLISGCAGQAEPQKQESPSISIGPAGTPFPEDLSGLLPLVPGAKSDPLSVRDGVYTFCWMTDTQYYSQDYPWIFQSMTAFLKNSAQRMDLKYIMHTGDLVNKMWGESQWDIALECLENLDGIPFGLLGGNHDVSADGVLDFAEFGKRFGKSYVKGKSFIGGSYENSRGRYDLLNIGHTKYLFVYMSYGPDEECLDWVNSVFEKYPDRAGFLLLHEYYDSDGVLTEAGKTIYERVVKHNPNLYMVLCGHRYTSALHSESIDDDGDGRPDRTVHQMIADYQKAAFGGAGYMRFLQIDERNKEIRVLTYSPYKDDFDYYDPKEYPEKDEFTLDAEWLGGE
jgi:hypothetical protein